jgi:hypothetical protein
LFGVLFFKLEEEENTALLLHLPELFAEDCYFKSAYEKRCCLVVAIAQAVLLVKQQFFGSISRRLLLSVF